ncbi:hypothetical protein AAVH_39419, partial [Aphelenchoides avenae]
CPADAFEASSSRKRWKRSASAFWRMPESAGTTTTISFTPLSPRIAGTLAREPNACTEPTASCTTA